MFGSPKTNGTEAPANAQDSGMPLFFSKPQMISADAHANAKVKEQSLLFARTTNSIPLTAADVVEASKSYPIVFTQGDVTLPVAIVGFEQQNYFVDSHGKWRRGRYVPSYVRKYPFVFVETPGSDQLALCVDEPALTFDAKVDGAPLYTSGQASEYTNNALQFCAAYQEQHRYGLAFCEALKAKNMLAPQRMDVELASGHKAQLAGFQMIDAEKLKNLTDADVLDWYNKGYLALMYHCLQSQSNWNFLLDLGNIAEAARTNKKK